MERGRAVSDSPSNQDTEEGLAAGAEVRRRRPRHLRRHRRLDRRASDGRAHERRGAQAHHRDRRGLVFLALAPGAVEEGRKLRPHPARHRDAGRLRPGCGLDQGRAARRRAPATPGGGPASTGWCRSSRPARSRSNSATPTRRSTRTRSTTRSSDQRFDQPWPAPAIAGRAPDAAGRTSLRRCRRCRRRDCPRTPRSPPRRA